MQFRQAKTEIVSASKVAYRFLAGVASNNSTVSPESPSNSSSRGTPRFQASWFKNLISSVSKPSSSSELENQDEIALKLPPPESPPRQNSRHEI